MTTAADSCYVTLRSLTRTSDMWLNQDGGTCHRDDAAQDLLKQKFSHLKLFICKLANAADSLLCLITTKESENRKQQEKATRPYYTRLICLVTYNKSIGTTIAFVFIPADNSFTYAKREYALKLFNISYNNFGGSSINHSNFLNNMLRSSKRSTK
uniref:Uncharacterized protein n=1 Tax=Glossina austeni TaxID=7395 RepID=A0A1A9UDT8_GLOAU